MLKSFNKLLSLGRPHELTQELKVLERRQGVNDLRNCDVRLNLVNQAVLDSLYLKDTGWLEYLVKLEDLMNESDFVVFDVILLNSVDVVQE